MGYHFTTYLEILLCPDYFDISLITHSSSFRDRYYYWNTVTDQVSWLSPLHPNVDVTISAEKLLSKYLDPDSEMVYYVHFTWAR